MQNSTGTSLVFNPADGTFSGIYSDKLQPVLASLLGDDLDHAIFRASHVEPCPGGWCADMRPLDGPCLGPFALRADALEAEQDWILDHFGS